MANLQRLEVPPGGVLIREGETGSECFIIGEGAVGVTRTDGGDQRVLAVVGAGGVQRLGDDPVISWIQTRHLQARQLNVHAAVRHQRCRPR